MRKKRKITRNYDGIWHYLNKTLELLIEKRTNKLLLFLPSWVGLDALTDAFLLFEC